jgi:NADPH:quinone reductase-like Zn-dependent oxidoreductase
MPSSVNPKVKSQLRFLRKKLLTKDTKHIGYECLAFDVGEDCREALEFVKLAAEKGLIRPRLQSVLPFADAPRAFEMTLRDGQTKQGSMVVKLSYTTGLCTSSN